MEPWKAVLPRIARLALQSALQGQAFPVRKREELARRFPELLRERAVFVTLTRQGRLRGCMGSLLPRRPLIDDVIDNARAAAFKDTRFPPLTREELDEVDIEVSLLSLPRPLQWEDETDLRRKLRPGVDGVILRFGGHRATFLPSVWEQLPDFDRFFQHLCLKAGLSADCLRLRPEISIYQAEKVGEGGS